MLVEDEMLRVAKGTEVVEEESLKIEEVEEIEIEVRRWWRSRKRKCIAIPY